MLKFIFIIIYAAEITHQVSSLIIYDVGTQVPKRQYGNAIITMYLKSIDVFYVTYGDITYCDFLYPKDSPNRWCDLMAFSQVCILRQDLMGHRTAKDYEGVNRRTFTVDSNENVNDEILNKVDLICSNISKYQFDQSNSMYFPNDNLYFMSTIDAPYADIFTFTNYMGDDYFTGRGYLEDYGIYNVYVRAGYTQLQYSIKFQVFTYLQIFKSKMFEEYVIKAKCSLNYYGKTCWFTCTDNQRLSCNCIYQDVYVNVPCQSQCKDGWLKKYVNYIFKEFYEVILTCNTMNVCTNTLAKGSTNCLPPKTCLPVDNATYYCEYILPYIQSYEVHGKNLSDQIFFYNEIISVTLDEFILIHKDVAVNSTASIYYKQYVFETSILHYRFEILKPSFIVITDKVIDQLLNFTITFNLKAWEYVMEQTKMFRIFRRPEVVSIYRFDNKTPLMYYTLIGDTLFAISNALPQYRTIVHWISNFLEFPFPFGSLISIPTSSPLGHVKFMCNITLITQSRSMVSVTKTSSVFIKLFEYLRWNNTNNFLESSSVSQCQTKSNILYKLEVIQIQGDYQIITTSDYITTAGLPGGQYGFVCYFLTNIGFLYSAYLEFRLQFIVSKICTFLFANVHGSIIQCGHDGYNQDEYNTRVALYAWNGNDFQFAVDGKRYLRIPYQMHITLYRFHCTVQNKFISSVILSLQFKDYLYQSTRQRYPFTSLNKYCLKYQEYVEIPLASHFADEQVNLEHKVLTLSIDNMENISLIFACFLCTTSVFLFGILIQGIYLKGVSERTSIGRANIDKMKQIKLASINTRLNIETRKTIILTNPALKDISKAFLGFTVKTNSE